jgi:hypothetical protein
MARVMKRVAKKRDLGNEIQKIGHSDLRIGNGCPIWTEDTGFFGCGVATWTSHLEIFLRDPDPVLIVGSRRAGSSIHRRRWRSK